MTNVRRSKKGLNTNQVKELNYAWQHATNIGRPLNAFITIRPIDIDSTPPPTERCRLFAAVRNKLGVYARLRRFEPMFIWSRRRAVILTCALLELLPISLSRVVNARPHSFLRKQHEARPRSRLEAIRARLELDDARRNFERRARHFS